MFKKDFKLKIKEVDDSSGEFVGYAAIFGNVDLQGDVIEKGAFRKTIQEQSNVPILWQHDTTQPIGVTVEIDEDDRGLLVKGKLNLETQRGREAYALIKQGAIKGLSIGYDVVKDVIESGVRKIKEIRLWEWSLVTFPANPLAEVTNVKTAVAPHTPPVSESSNWNADEAEQRVREWASDGDTIDWAKYREAFAWYDSENPERFGSYKLPHHDIENGQLVTVWRGVAAAAAALSGARGGVDIPTADIDGVKQHLSTHYKQFNQTPPWEKDKDEEFTDAEKSSDDTLDAQPSIESKFDDLLAEIRAMLSKYGGVEDGE